MAVVIQDVLPYTQYVVTNPPAIYSFPWQVYAAGDISVYWTPSGVAPNDATQLLVLNVGYTVTLNPPPINPPGITGSPSPGGIITIITNPLPAVGDTLTIVRSQSDARNNYYINGGQFLAPIVNTDFNSDILMIQQNKMYDTYIAPHYNVSATINQPVDCYLPVLKPGCVWWKNANNTAIVSLAVNPPTSAGVVLPTTPGNLLVAEDAFGTYGTSVIAVSVGGNLTGIVNLTATGTVQGANVIATSTVTGVNVAGTTKVSTPSLYLTNGIHSVEQSAPVLAQNSTYTVPALPPTQDASQFLTSTIAGVQTWGMGSAVTRTNVTSAQILQMYATPVQVLPAPPANTLYLVHSYAILYTYVTTAYTGAHNIFLQYGSTGNAGGTPATVVQASAGFTDQVQSVFVEKANSAGPFFAGTVGLGVYLTNATANLTLGDGTFIVYVTYTLVPTI